MRLFLFAWLVLVFCACNPEGPDNFRPLTEDQRRLLPSSYRDGDTVSFLYTDTAGSDTQRFVVKDKDYIYSAMIPEYSSNDEYEVRDKELISLDSAHKLNIAVGCLGLSDALGGQFFYVRYDGLNYERYLSEMKNDPDTVFYQMRVAHDKYWEPDSVFITYSTQTGLHRLQDFFKGYKLEKLP